MERKKQMDLDDEERLQKFIEKQIERANEEYPTDEPVYTELQKDDDVKSVLHYLYSQLRHDRPYSHAVTFSLSKIKEEGSSSQLEAAEASGSKSEVKEEVELDPELSAVPPPSIECKQEGFVRPKPLNVKYVCSVCTRILHIFQVHAFYRPMEKNIFKSASAEVKPVIKPKEKEERLAY